MLTRYEQAKNIHGAAVETHDANKLLEILPLLNSCGIQCREDDGELLWTNLSIPTSVGGAITIGLRYKKLDRTLTEDIFELNEKNPDVITKYYTGSYQKFRSEYEHTHKRPDVETRSFRTVNTCCLYLGS